MPLDFSIPMQAFRGQFDPAEATQRAFTLKSLMDEQKLRQIQTEDALDKRTRAKTLRDLLSGAVTPDGQVDAAKVRGAYVQTGDLEGLTAFNTSEAQAAKAQREADKARVEQGILEHKTIAQLAGAATDEASWRSALAQAKGMGLDTSQFEGMPYDPELVRRIRASALDAAGQFEQEWKAKNYALDVAKFGYQQQNDAAQRAVTIRGQDMTRGNALISAQAQAPLRDLQVQKLQGELDAKAKEKEGAAASFDTAIATIDRLRSHKGMGDAVGWQSMFPTLPGGDAANFEAELDALKAQTFLPMVQSLRGMGALSNAEGEKLTNAIGALSTTQSEQAFKTSLGRIKADLMKARARTGAKGAPAAAPKGGWSIERVN